MKKNGTRGLGLLELLLSLSVVAVLVLTSVNYYQSVRTAHNVTLATNMYRDIVKATQRFISHNEPKNVSMQKLISEDLLTKQYETNPWAGKTTVNTTQKGRLFVTIKMEGVPKSACLNLAGQLVMGLTSSEAVNSKDCQKGIISATYELN